MNTGLAVAAVLTLAVVALFGSRLAVVLAAGQRHGVHRLYPRGAAPAGPQMRVDELRTRSEREGLRCWLPRSGR